MLNIQIVSCLNDNYSYIIHDEVSNLVGVIDPSEFKTIDKIISLKYKKIDYILNTHHHFDHVGGNQDLKKKYNSKIVASEKDKNRIAEIDILINDNKNFNFGKTQFKVLFTPGHTDGQVFYCEKEKIIFTGDTLFSLGCGKVFEGTLKQMYDSLNKIKKLPKITKIYCGHEYTESNLKFCITADRVNLTIFMFTVNSRTQLPIFLSFQCNELRHIHTLSRTHTYTHIHARTHTFTNSCHRI